MKANNVSVNAADVPDITVVMPAFNPSAANLERSVSSVLSQGTSFELIIVDDGSDSEIASIMDRWAENHPAITVIHKLNGGVSSARNYGMRYARGEYVTFIDSDDCFLAGAFEKGFRVARESEADVIFGGMRKIYINGSSLESRQSFGGDQDWSLFSGTDMEVFKGALFDDQVPQRLGLSRARYYSNCGTFYRRSLVSELAFRENILFCEDSIFNWDALSRASSVAVADGVWYEYVENIASATKRYRPYVLSEMEPTALAFEELRNQASADIRQALDNGIYLYCFYRLYACSILCDGFLRQSGITATRFIKMILGYPVYRRLLREISPQDKRAALIVSLARRDMAVPIAFLVVWGNKIMDAVKKLKS